MADTRTEFEIKFAGPPEALAALPGSALVYALTRGEGAWRRLTTTYYDTPDEALRREGLSLRIRDDNGRRLRQTVKRKSAEGGLARIELETGLEAREQFPAPTGDGDLDALLGSFAQDLRPVATSDIDRWSSEFSFRNSRLEIAVDLGAAIVPAETGASFKVPIAETELELVEGAAEDLFSAAKLLLSDAGLRLADGTKLEAALIAARGEKYALPRRERLDPSPEDSAGDLFARALALIAHRIIALQPAIIEARAAEGVHQMRVELRRFRALERTYRKIADSGRLRRLAAKARALAKALEPARDWDVFIDETLEAAAGYDYAKEGFTILNAFAAGRRAEGWAQAVTTIGGPEFRAFTLDLLRTAYAPPWRTGDNKHLNQPAKAFAAKALDRTLRKAREISRDIDPGDPSARHPLRVALKKLRYSVQLFRRLYPKEQRKSYMAAMTTLQDAFGAVNDAVVAQRLANDAAAGGGQDAMRAAGFVAGLYAAKAEAAADDIDKAWAAFERMIPFWR